jgi:hypothetical protein
VLPVKINPAAVSAAEVEAHNKIVQLLMDNREMCTSHTVLMLDFSASMNTCDVKDFKTRSDAVIATLALDFVGQQIDKGINKLTDVVSLYIFSDCVESVFVREPISNVLFNKILGLRTLLKPRSHGHYFPAILELESILISDLSHSNCGLMVLFLSDGKPSDHFHVSPVLAQRKIIDAAESLGHRYGSRLTFEAIGFGSSSDFAIMQQIVTALKDCGTEASFQHVDQRSAALSAAFSSVVSSLSATKLRTSKTGEEKRALRPGTIEVLSAAQRNSKELNSDWIVRNGVYDDVSKCTPLWHEATGMFDCWSFCKLPHGVAIRKTFFAQGAERRTLLFRELDESGQMTGQQLVAKESLFADGADEGEKELVQIYTCKLLVKAQGVAKVFNQRIESLVTRNLIAASDVASMNYLQCFPYVWCDADGFDHGVMVEKQLEGIFTKWNGNNGFVKHSSGVQELELLLNEVIEKKKHLEMQHSTPLTHTQLDAVMEEDEDDGDESDGDEIEFADVQQAIERLAQSNNDSVQKKLKVNVLDYPQAFSHFSYILSRRKILVCDIQGVLHPRTDSTPHVFELTDPVIHHCLSSSSHHYRRYGLTDHGTKGMNKFFITHECNNLCRLLGLPRDSNAVRK